MLLCSSQFLGGGENPKKICPTGFPAGRLPFSLVYASPENPASAGTAGALAAAVTAEYCCTTDSIEAAADAVRS